MPTDFPPPQEPELVDDSPEALLAWMTTHARTRSTYWRQIITSAAGSDEERLKLIAAHMQVCEDHAESMRELRDEVATRLREQGVPMTRISALARVSDSYLARRIFGRGGRRKFIRGTTAFVTLAACALGAVMPETVTVTHEPPTLKARRSVDAAGVRAL